jgi:hypothetical protein
MDDGGGVVSGAPGVVPGTPGVAAAGAPGVAAGLAADFGGGSFSGPLMPHEVSASEAMHAMAAA